MTPDELRALADALEPMSSAPRFEGMNVLAFCKWLRAQADAQPVAWQYRWKGSRALHYTLFDPAERDTQEIIDVQPLYFAPAAPQADAQPVAWRCEVRGDGTDPALDDLQAKERA